MPYDDNWQTMEPAYTVRSSTQNEYVHFQYMSFDES